MGFVVPPFNLDPRQYDRIYDTIAQVIADKFDEKKRADITWRPMRPEEINATLTPATRVYNSGPLAATGVYQRILGGIATPAVLTGSVYVFFGWIFIDDPLGIAPIGTGGVVQLQVQGTPRAEAALYPIQVNGQHVLLTWDQIVIIGEQTTFDILFKGLIGGVGIVYPLAFRLGPHSQLDTG